MQLYLRRTQRAGIISRNAFFCIDARAELTADEKSSVHNYRLGREIIYNSQKANKHFAKMDASLDGSAKGLAKGLMYSALARMSLRITINSLTRGQRIECKDLQELMGAEQAIRTACENIRNYHDVAQMFDGREEVLDYPGVNGPAQNAPARITGPSSAMGLSREHTFTRLEDDSGHATDVAISNFMYMLGNKTRDVFALKFTKPILGAAVGIYIGYEIFLRMF